MLQTRMRIVQDCRQVFIVLNRDAGVVHVRDDVDVPSDLTMRNIPFLTFIYVLRKKRKLNCSALLWGGRTCFLQGAMWDPRSYSTREEDALASGNTLIAKEYLATNERDIGVEVAKAHPNLKKSMSKQNW